MPSLQSTSDRFLLAAALVCASVAPAACSSDSTRGSSSSPASAAKPGGADPVAPIHGRELYDEHCAECHGLDGISTEGNPAAPNLAGQGLLAVADDEFLFQNTARARPGANSQGQDVADSPAFGVDYGGPLSDDDIRDIIVLLRQWQTEPSVELGDYIAEGDPPAGASLYNTCAPCHGASGWSSRAPSLAGETLQDTASDAFFRHTILHGRPRSEMVGFDLEEREIADLIAHIRALGSSPRTAGGD